MAITNNQVAVIDYGLGNLFSVKRACNQVGLNPVVTADPSLIMKSDAMILPGVGAFGDAMDKLNKLDLSPLIKGFIDSGRPFMGICLGMQLLMSESEEFGRNRGLDVIKGRVVKFPLSQTGHKIKVPQVGWNRIYHAAQTDSDTWQNTMLQGIENNEFMYFVHSFYVVPDDPRVALSRTNYEGIEYSSSLQLDNIFACQFHPEKSASEGMKLYKNFEQFVKRSKDIHG